MRSIIDDSASEFAPLMGSHGPIWNKNKFQIRRRSQVDDMLMNSISQIVEYNLVDDIADTVIKQVCLLSIPAYVIISIT